MSNNTFTETNLISHTPFGLYYEQKLIAPIQIARCIPILDFSDSFDTPDLSYRLDICIVTNAPSALSKETPAHPTFFPANVQLQFNPLKPYDTVSHLKQRGVLPRDAKPYIAAHVLSQAVEHYLQSHADQPEYINDREGWILCNGSWYYMTSDFAISANGLHSEHHCQPASCHLLFDDSLNVVDAFQQTLELLNQDFPVAATIFSGTILSLLGPLQKKHGLPYFPGLLIAGEPDRGKTQLAIHFGRFLTERSGELKTVFLLQDSAKQFDHIAKGICDSPLILDDFRLTKSQAISQASTTVLEKTVHAASQENLGAPLIMITGETEALAQIAGSSMDRMILVTLEYSAKRNELIRQLNRNPLVVRTCMKHLISYLALAFSNNALDEVVNNNEEVFSQYLSTLPNGDGRMYKNLKSSFLAFRCFLRFGIHSNAIDACKEKEMLQMYGDVLAQSALLQKNSSPTEQHLLIVAEILRRLRLHIAQPGEYRYLKKPNDYAGGLCLDIYGHHAVLNLKEGYEGLYLAKENLILDYHGSAYPNGFWIVSYDRFIQEYRVVRATAARLGCHSCPKGAPAFLKALRKDNFLLAQDRHDPARPGGVNFKFTNWPALNQNGEICDSDVLILSIPLSTWETLKPHIAEKDKAHLEELSQFSQTNGYPFYKDNAPCRPLISELINCARILETTI